MVVIKWPARAGPSGVCGVRRSPCVAFIRFVSSRPSFILNPRRYIIHRDDDWRNRVVRGSFRFSSWRAGYTTNRILVTFCISRAVQVLHAVVSYMWSLCTLQLFP
ncbi:uncharacterized protein K489DRAFT_258457 [Dissoconium aciculare CBS 342.82]|uniref:Uncharacterized protein n=1 Tax=Dissoconium aciculare CBS 342.82 TaxID=1314786 RepID=A0A6J3M1U4_9PEZI|nr:uncharacterized protein K489DRAFT_258457 [Dissoconium aciculare CBS 342.82]KAF1821873.1 hypothetical protein K489DRAFT_258457 [Dissoconium aciculare CBS 342.82]